MSDRLEDRFVIVDSVGRLVRDKISVTEQELKSLQSYIDTKIIEARIDELNKTWHEVNRVGHHNIKSAIDDRIKALNHRKER